MDASVTTLKQGPDARAETLVSSYERAGYVRVAPAMLQPAEPFLDLSGEDIRRRMYLTTAPDGEEFCLRPDLTIPVSRDYLASSAAGKPVGFCYLGPVFRHRTDGPAEFLQAGIESFGRSDRAAADAEMLSLGLEATAHYGVPSPDIQIGDVAIVRGPRCRARPSARLEAEAHQGFQPQVQPGAGPRPPCAGRKQRTPRVSGRAGRTRRLRSERRPRADNRPVVDRRHQCRWRPLGRRNCRPLSRTIRARRERQAATRCARPHRAFSRDPGQSRWRCRHAARVGQRMPI